MVEMSGQYACSDKGVNVCVTFVLSASHPCDTTCGIASVCMCLCVHYICILQMLILNKVHNDIARVQ